jgi:hypothetical protein
LIQQHSRLCSGAPLSRDLFGVVDSEHAKLGAQMLRYLSRDWKHNRLATYEQDPERVLTTIPWLQNSKPDPVDVNRRKFVSRKISDILQQSLNEERALSRAAACH